MGLKDLGLFQTLACQTEGCAVFQSSFNPLFCFLFNCPPSCHLLQPQQPWCTGREKWIEVWEGCARQCSRFAGRLFCVLNNFFKFSFQLVCYLKKRQNVAATRNHWSPSDGFVNILGSGCCYPRRRTFSNFLATSKCTGQFVYSSLFIVTQPPPPPTPVYNWWKPVSAVPRKREKQKKKSFIFFDVRSDM